MATKFWLNAIKTSLMQLFGLEIYMMNLLIITLNY